MPQFHRRDLLLAGGAAAVSLATSTRTLANADPVADRPAGEPFRYALNMSTIRGQQLSLSEQVDVAAKAGATYISIFAGRVADEGGNAPEVIMNSVEWLEHWNYDSKIIVGSIRSVGDVLDAAIAGSHIITIPPQFLDKMADHKYTRATAGQFITDAQKALEMMEKARLS